MFISAEDAATIPAVAIGKISFVNSAGSVKRTAGSSVWLWSYETPTQGD